MASGFRFETMMDAFENIGILDVALPFLLVFTIVFAVLEKTKILGEDKRNLNVVLSLILGLSVVFAHQSSVFAPSFDPVEIINKALPSVSILVVAIMMLLVIIGVFAHDRVFLGVTMPGWIAFFSILAIVFIFGSAAGWWGDDIGAGALVDFFGEDAIAVAVMLIVFAIVIAFITGGGREKEGALENFRFNLGKLFGPGGKH